MKEYETEKGFKVKEYDETLTVCDCITKRGWYRFLVYDTTQGMNIGVSDKSEIDALFAALKYYQKRNAEIKSELKSLQTKVDGFLSQFSEEDEDE